MAESIGLTQQSPSSRGAFFRATASGPIVFGLLPGLYIVLMPHLDLLSRTGMYNEQRILQVAILMIFSTGLLVSTTVRNLWLACFNQLPKITRWVIGIVFVGGALSAALAPSPRHAFLEVAVFFLLGCSALGIALCGRQLGSVADRLALGAIVASVSCYLMAFLAGYAAAIVDGVSLSPISIRNLFPGFANIRFFGQFQSWTLPLIVLAPLFFGGSVKLRRLLGFLAMAWWMLALASGTRGTWLGMLAAVSVIGLACPRQAQFWLKLQARAFLGGVGLYVLFFNTMPYLLGLDPPGVVAHTFERFASSPGRMAIWSQSLDMIAAHPWLGVGPMHFAYYPNDVAAHPHNSVLQWGAEWGVPSALVVVSLVCWGLWAFVKKIRANLDNTAPQQTLRVGLLASLLAGAAHSLVSGIIVMAYSQMLMVFVAGWMLALHCQQAPDDPPVTRRQHVILVSIVLGALATLESGMLPEAFNPTAYQKAFVTEHPGVGLRPRFWQQGFIYE